MTASRALLVAETLVAGCGARAGSGNGEKVADLRMRLYSRNRVMNPFRPQPK